LTDEWSFIIYPDRISAIKLKEKQIRTIEVYKQHHEQIRDAETDDVGNLWVTLKNDIIKITPELTQTFYSDIVEADELISILPDQDGSVWIRTLSSLIHLHESGRTNERFLIHKKNEKVTYEAIHEMAQDGEGNIWLSVPAWGGLVRFNRSLKMFERFPHEPNDIFTVNSNYIRKLYYSKDDNILWIGTEAGLNKIVFNKQDFIIKEDNSPNQGNNFIRELYQDSELNLWVKYDGGRIYPVINKEDASVKTTVEKVAAMKPVLFLRDDENGNLLFVIENGVISLNKITGQIKILNDQYIQKTVWPIHLLGSKIVAESEGRILFIPIEETLRIERDIPFHESAEGVKFLIDQFGNILAFKNEGVFILDSTKEVFIKMYDSKRNDHELDINVMLKDPEGFLWLGTGGSGLIRYDPKSDESVNFGFADHTINGILVDDEKKIWASTNKGLIMVNQKTKAVINFTSQDGLRINQVRHGAFLKGRDGLFYLGGERKILAFDPLKIKAEKFTPPVVITDIKVLNKSIAEINHAYSSLETASPIEVQHNQNTLALEFVSPNFAYPENTIYSYQMVGVDQGWVSSTTNQIIYSNLSPGNYRFRVKASNPHNEKDSEIREIEFSILSPPWKTWWAYVIYAGVVMFLSYFIWKRTVTRSHLKTLATIKSAEAETLREMDSLKSHFFANISHEFRTPLTLILSPLQKKIEESDRASEKAELSIMRRNALRLLTLVNQLLDLSRIEAGTLKLRCVNADLPTAILAISSQFSSMADSKRIHYEVVANSLISVYFDRDKLEKIISNLLSNAFKFTSEGGSISLAISSSSNQYFKKGFVEITIADTGIGIESEHLPKIFDRFYQVDMSSTRSYEGSGIGLSLTKELVELHHGTIEVKSEIQKGSTFIVRLPLGNDHLKPEEIISEPPNDIKNIESPLALTEIPEFTTDQQTHEESILIVEDNADLRSYMRLELQQSYSILEAVNGEEGVALALREIPSIVISDLMMPKKDGLDLCHELKEDERTSHIPVILLTAKADIESKLRGYHQGADDYVSKPFNLQELRVRIQNLITIRKKLHAKFASQTTILPSEISVDSADGRFLKKAVGIIETHIADSGFGVEILARELAVSQTQLYRKLQGVTGSGPNEFIRHIRLLRAADLLRKKVGNVSEVAYQSGFNNLSYFSRAFKDKFNVTPSEFEKSNQSMHSIQ
ncbi:MAG TPA: ATP-binding protein, partial [Cyclobacteriaceae bacterium]|nr:ATP-binding protein [Cyclobacteriaceae bacterium]